MASGSMERITSSTQAGWRGITRTTDLGAGSLEQLRSGQLQLQSFALSGEPGGDHGRDPYQVHLKFSDLHARREVKLVPLDLGRASPLHNNRVPHGGVIYDLASVHTVQWI
jgi:hypothetical protein